jgi:hypothetical protein
VGGGDPNDVVKVSAARALGASPAPRPAVLVAHSEARCQEVSQLR